jgi:hypothetical protein
MFAQTDKVKAFVRIYQGGREALRAINLEAQILDSSGAVVFDSPKTLIAGEFGAAREADHTIELPLSSLGAGPHLLRVPAATGNASAHRDVPFVVR